MIVTLKGMSYEFLHREGKNKEEIKLLNVIAKNLKGKDLKSEMIEIKLKPDSKIKDADLNKPVTIECNVNAFRDNLYFSEI